MKPYGSITTHTRPDGVVVYLARITHHGRRRSIGYYATEQAAEDALAARREILGNDGRGLTLAAWGEWWLEIRAKDGVHRSVHKNRSVWLTHIAVAPFALWPLRRIASKDVRGWVRGLLRKDAHHRGKSLGRPLARQTVVNAFNLLRRALADAVAEGKLDANPAKEVEVPRVARADDGWTWLTVEEIARLRAAPGPHKASPQALPSITLAVFTGLRAGEIWGLRWCDVTLEGSRPELHVCRSYTGPTKGGRPRHVPLLPQALAVLRALPRGVGRALVFPGKRGQCHAEGYDAAWSSWKHSAGITRRVRFHDLRHTCASHLLQGTWTTKPLTLRQVQAWLGHASYTTTERYAHLAPDALHDAIRPDHLRITRDDGAQRNPSE